MKEFFTKYRWPIFIGIIIINFIFRMQLIGLSGLWFDETYSVQLAQKNVKKIIEVSFKEDVNPPVYGVILHYWMDAFGEDEASVRSFSAVAGSIAAGILFLFALNFFNWQTAIFSSIMFFVSNELFYYSQEARTYTLILILVLISNTLFLKLTKFPKWHYVLFLAIINAIIFYTHFLAFLVVFGQIIAFPFLTGTILKLPNESENSESKLVFNFRPIVYFFISLLLTAFMLYNYIERLGQIAKETGKSVWLFKPTYTEFKTAVYELFNSKELYQVFIFSSLAILVLLFIPKLREKGVSKKMIIFALIMGPGLLYLNYFISLYITPIFLKRYVLFTLIGFILFYSYVFSLVKIHFNIKLGLFIVLAFFFFKTIKFPRETYYEYDQAVPLLKEIQSYKKNKVLVVSDMQDLFSYYYDKKIFHIDAYHLKHLALRNKNVYTPFNLTWPQDEDFSKYTHIYYARTFDGYTDPGGTIDKMLNEKYKRVGEIRSYYGVKITHYYNQSHK